jgi:hypothetical protein
LIKQCEGSIPFRICLRFFVCFSDDPMDADASAAS